MSKEILKVERWLTAPDRWRVEFRARNGLIYWKNVKAKDEMEAFMLVMGIRK